MVILYILLWAILFCRKARGSRGLPLRKDIIGFADNSIELLLLPQTALTFFRNEIIFDLEEK